MQLFKRILTSAALTAALTLPFAAIAQTPAPAKTPAPATTMPAPKATKAAPTAADIADAKAKGLVWCNNNSKVYHLSDSKFYGTTKNGKFLSVDDAKKAGFKQAQDNPTSKKKAAAATTAPAK
jgi:hypothetical protein